MLRYKRKPSWLNKKVSLKSCQDLKRLLRGLKLHTVCEESLCPNISECFSSGAATFMILGDICTRNCSFCGVAKGDPADIDQNEPQRIKEAVKRLGLNYIVITSVTRDDLDDGGADMFCKTIKAIKEINNNKKVEILIPDFLGRRDLLGKVACGGAEVIAHNLEMPASLYIKVRNKSSYQRSLKVLKSIKEINKAVFTKSGLMLGLGETEQEVLEALGDLKRINCDFLTLGQYLPPSVNHYPLREYIHPDKFEYFKKYALNLGFKGVKSSAYIRSSYLAHSFLTF